MTIPRTWILTAAVALASVAPPLARRAAAHLPEADDRRLDENTALTVGAETLKVGLQTIEYGIIDRLSVGTDPPFWAIRAATALLVPNLHVKLVFYRSGLFWLTGRASAYYADLSSGGNSGHLTVIPLSIFASYGISPHFWVHGEVTYLPAFGSGAGNLHDVSTGGAAASRAAQLAAILEWRLTKVFAITLAGRFQFYTADVAFSGTGTPDQYTTVSVDARLSPLQSHPWNVVPGVAFLWRRVHLIGGVGYGNYFLPGADVPLSKQTIVPELSASIYF